jgi:hypothetical protein
MGDLTADSGGSSATYGTAFQPRRSLPATTSRCSKRETDATVPENPGPRDGKWQQTQ